MPLARRHEHRMINSGGSRSGLLSFDPWWIRGQVCGGFRPAAALSDGLFPLKSVVLGLDSMPILMVCRSTRVMGSRSVLRKGWRRERSAAAAAKPPAEASQACQTQP